MVDVNAQTQCHRLCLWLSNDFEVKFCLTNSQLKLGHECKVMGIDLACVHNHKHGTQPQAIELEVVYVRRYKLNIN